MSAKKHLFIGYGKLASRCAEQLVSRGDQVFGLARTQRLARENVTLWQGDIKSAEVLSRLSNETFDTATLILTPSVYTDVGYDETYVQSIKAISTIWSSTNSPERIVFISSSSVYGQSDGERVNEASICEPSKPTAKKLREAEMLLLDTLPHAQVIRFSGIYGPGRDYLLRQVWAGKSGDESYTNRIHEDDCIGVICHAIVSDSARQHRILLASDCEPVKGSDIRQWLAKKMGVELTVPTVPSARVGNKRCDNHLLQASGYQFLYPSYKEGYEVLVQEFLKRVET